MKEELLKSEDKRIKRAERRKKRKMKKEATPTASVVVSISPLNKDEMRILINLLEKATGHKIMDMGPFVHLSKKIK